MYMSYVHERLVYRFSSDCAGKIPDDYEGNTCKADENTGISYFNWYLHVLHLKCV